MTKRPRRYAAPSRPFALWVRMVKYSRVAANVRQCRRPDGSLDTRRAAQVADSRLGQPLQHAKGTQYRRRPDGSLVPFDATADMLRRPQHTSRPGGDGK